MSYVQGNIIRDGTGQNDRYATALQPANVPVDRRSEAYWLKYVAKLAKGLHYYNLQYQRRGDWSGFFPEPEAVETFLAELSERRDTPPHLALFLAFNKLLTVLRADFNQLTEKHLLFYYQDYLRFPFRKAKADQANVIFQLSKNAKGPVRLPVGTRLNAGKDASGAPVEFTLDQELIVNEGQLSELRTILVDHEYDQRIFAAPVANSADGIGKSLPADRPFWPVFGESQLGKSGADRTMLDARMGMAIGAPVLLLREGQREITIILTLRAYGLNQDQLNTLVDAGLPQEIADSLQPILDEYRADEASYRALVEEVLGKASTDLYFNRISTQFYAPLRGLDLNTLLTAFKARTTNGEGFSEVGMVSTFRQGTGFRQIRLQISLDDTFPAIQPNVTPAADAQYPTELPVVELLLNESGGSYLYQVFRNFLVDQVDINVVVNGLQQLVVSNADGVLDPTKAFLPFGAAPRTGAPLYIGSEEAFSKQLDSLAVEWFWMDLPDNDAGFSDYYGAYEWDQDTTNADFTATAALLHNGTWREASESTVQLFANADTTTTGQVLLETEAFDVAVDIPSLGPSAKLNSLQGGYQPGLKDGFIRLRLDQGFGHDVFPRLYADAAILKATTAPATELPNQPYTPKLGGLSLNYSASQSWQAGASLNVGEVQLFHTLPFGIQPLAFDNPEPMVKDLPQGTLYLGLEKLSPPQNISFLFQMAEGSADPTITVERNDLQWSYLAGEQWVDFIPGVSIITDTSSGLQTSGILQFALGAEASIAHLQMPAGRYWLRAQFDKPSAGIGQVLDIQAQAMVATRIMNETTLEQGYTKLEGGEIKKLSVRENGIKKVSQPYPSFGGSSAENLPDYSRRVSERLRHRRRAVTIWDYERLVLEAFPSVYKVKCIPHTNANSELAPGACTMIVIPNLRGLTTVNQLEPRASSVLRQEITSYLQALQSPFSSVFVENPRYEQIMVQMSVGLKAGYDGAYYGNLLNQEIKAFLSPWAFEEGKDIAFGGKIYRSAILGFVESREYVDFVTAFNLYQQNRGGGIGEMCVEIDFVIRDEVHGDLMEVAAEASTARSILVSAAEHQITILDPGSAGCARTSQATGIGAMTVEIDFIVV